MIAILIIGKREPRGKEIDYTVYPIHCKLYLSHTSPAYSYTSPTYSYTSPTLPLPLPLRGLIIRRLSEGHLRHCGIYHLASDLQLQSSTILR